MFQSLLVFDHIGIRFNVVSICTIMLLIKLFRIGPVTGPRLAVLDRGPVTGPIRNNLINEIFISSPEPKAHR